MLLYFCDDHVATLVKLEAIGENGFGRFGHIFMTQKSCFRKLLQLTSLMHHNIKNSIRSKSFEKDQLTVPDHQENELT